MELTVFLYLLILVFSVLQIILFFKIWGMTNDVEKIKYNSKRNILLVQSQACYLKGDVEKAKELLVESFYLELSNLRTNCITFERWEKDYKATYYMYSRIAQKIGATLPDYEEFNNIEKYY